MECRKMLHYSNSGRCFAALFNDFLKNLADESQSMTPRVLHR